MVGDGVSNLKRPAASLVGLWADAVALQRAAAAIAVRPGADDDLRFTASAGHCGEAADEIQRAYPNIAQLGDVPALAAQGEPLATGRRPNTCSRRLRPSSMTSTSTTQACSQPTCSPPRRPRRGLAWRTTRLAVGCRDHGRR